MSGGPAGIPSLGERLADRVAAFGGSWTFIFCFAAVLLAWVLLNSGVLAHWHRAFDPYPYILLNLFLSMLAAIQAPVIMMSQNRQAAKDRQQARHDYEVNLRAETEIAALHDKLDALRELELAEAMDRIERRLGGAGLPARPATRGNDDEAVILPSPFRCGRRSRPGDDTGGGDDDPERGDGARESADEGGHFRAARGELQ